MFITQIKNFFKDLSKSLTKFNFKGLLELSIYYNYKVDLLLLYYGTRMPYYLIFIFCFFFGNFGAPEQLTDNVLFLNTFPFFPLGT